MTEPSTPADVTPEGQTPAAPDVDKTEGGNGDAGRTPSNPDNDMPDGGSA